MASRTQAPTALLLSLINVLFFSLQVSGCGPCGGPTPKLLPPPPPPPPPCAPSTPTPSSPTAAKCPTDTVKLGACANVLNGLINPVLGKPPKEPCCSLLQGLTDVEAAVCLCTVLKENVLGLINLTIPVNLSLLLNYCGKSAPSGFMCP